MGAGERDMDAKGLIAAPRMAKLWKKYRLVALFTALGLLLLLWPESSDAQETVTAAEQDVFDLAQVQREMETILSEIDGAGRLHLMLTVASGTKRELAEDSTLRYSGTRTSPTEYERTQETLTVARGSGTQEVVVTRSVYPDYIGALVVCEGADSAAVRLAVTQAVATLTGLSSERIAVVKGAD